MSPYNSCLLFKILIRRPCEILQIYDVILACKKHFQIYIKNLIRKKKKLPEIDFKVTNKN